VKEVKKGGWQLGGKDYKRSGKKGGYLHCDLCIEILTSDRVINESLRQVAGVHRPMPVPKDDFLPQFSPKPLFLAQ
jgi:hypothetical protein